MGTFYTPTNGSLWYKKMMLVGVVIAMETKPPEKLECIPVGCVPPTCWTYPVVLGGGVSTQVVGGCLSRGCMSV